SRHEISLELQAPQHHVRGDATRLRQVFWNLLKNAVRLTPPGGRIRVLTRSVGERHIRASVEDTGPGIAPEDIDRIFQPFEQSDSGSRRGGGLGLGLAVSRGFVTVHGGTLRALNTGTGARFDVVLTTVEADGDAPRRPPSVEHAIGSVDVLLV